MPVRSRTVPQQLPRLLIEGSITSGLAMRYHFNIKDGETLIQDLDGDELPDREAAVQQIRKTVEDIIRLPDRYGDFVRWARREFVVTDESGHTVLTMPVPAALLRTEGLSTSVGHFHP